MNFDFCKDFLNKEVAKVDVELEKKRKQCEKEKQEKERLEKIERQKQEHLKLIAERQRQEKLKKDVVESYQDLVKKKPLPMILGASKNFAQHPIALNDPVMHHATSKEFIEKIKEEEKQQFKANTMYDYAVRVDKPDTIYYFSPVEAKAKFHKTVGHSSILTENEQTQADKDQKPLIVYAGEFKTDGKGRVIGWNNGSGHFAPLKEYKDIFGKHFGFTKANGVSDDGSAGLDAFKSRRELVNMLWDGYYDDDDNDDDDDDNTDYEDSYSLHSRSRSQQLAPQYGYADEFNELDALHHYNIVGYKYSNNDMSAQMMIIAAGLITFLLCLMVLCIAYFCGLVSGFVANKLMTRNTSKTANYEALNENENQI